MLGLCWACAGVSVSLAWARLETGHWTIITQSSGPGRAELTRRHWPLIGGQRRYSALIGRELREAPGGESGEEQLARGGQR